MYADPGGKGVYCLATRYKGMIKTVTKQAYEVFFVMVYLKLYYCLL